MNVDGALLQKRREQLGLSQRALAGKAGVASAAIDRLEGGGNAEMMTVGALTKILEHLGITLSQASREPDHVVQPDTEGGGETKADYNIVAALLHEPDGVPVTALCAGGMSAEAVREAVRHLQLAFRGTP